MPLSLPIDAVMEGEALQQAASDFGGVVHQRPLAVARPRTVADVQAVVEYARTRRISVAARGRGHSTHGQAQARDGIVLDMADLASVRDLDADTVWVEGGASWSDVVSRTAPEGLAPPTLTDYLELSVGGTLSVGGVGGASFRYGTQTDNVLELEVVTGRGDISKCSDSQNKDLFDAVRAGVGQCGVIVGARIRLVPTPPSISVLQLGFSDAEALTRAHLHLALDSRTDYLDGTIVHNAAGELLHVLTVAHAGEPPDVRATGGAVLTERALTYLEFAHRVQAYFEHLKQLEVLHFRHPWLDLFLPSSAAVRFLSAVSGELESARDGMVLTYVLRRSLCRTPLLALPKTEEWIFLVDLVRNTPEARVEQDLARNSTLCSLGESLGAGIYPIGSMPSADWTKLHPGWAHLLTAKRCFDPDGIMTPGQGPV